jgi:hypothetical protein
VDIHSTIQFPAGNQKSIDWKKMVKGSYFNKWVQIGSIHQAALNRHPQQQAVKGQSPPLKAVPSTTRSINYHLSTIMLVTGLI